MLYLYGDVGLPLAFNLASLKNASKLRHPGNILTRCLPLLNSLRRRQRGSGSCQLKSPKKVATTLQLVSPGKKTKKTKNIIVNWYRHLHAVTTAVLHNAAECGSVSPVKRLYNEHLQTK